MHYRNYCFTVCCFWLNLWYWYRWDIWVMNEVFRLYPSAPNALRQAKDDIQVIKDITIPSVTNMWIDIVAMHRPWPKSMGWGCAWVQAREVQRWHTWPVGANTIWVTCRLLGLEEECVLVETWAFWRKDCANPNSVLVFFYYIFLLLIVIILLLCSLWGHLMAFL